jgi:hypothetical protein
VFAIGANKSRQDPNVVTGTFLLINCYAYMLFDTGVDKSFVSSEFALLIGLESSKMSESYSMELTNGRLVEARDIILGRALNLYDHQFSIDLMPMELRSFDVIVGMDWLACNKAEVVCHEKIVGILLPNGETLIIQGERPGKELRIISCMRARKYLLGQY